MIAAIDSDQTGETPRRVYYMVTDDYGVAHPYGPVMTSDPAFDAEAYKSVVIEKVTKQLAEEEFNQVIG